MTPEPQPPPAPQRPLCPVCNAVIPTDEPADNLHLCPCGKLWSNGEEYTA